MTLATLSDNTELETSVWGNKWEKPAVPLRPIKKKLVSHGEAGQNT